MSEERIPLEDLIPALMRMRAYLDKALDGYGTTVLATAIDEIKTERVARLQERERCAKAEPTDEMLRDGIRCFQQQAFDSADPLADWRAFFRIVNAAAIRALPEGE